MSTFELLVVLGVDLVPELIWRESFIGPVLLPVALRHDVVPIFRIRHRRHRRLEMRTCGLVGIHCPFLLRPWEFHPLRKLWELPFLLRTELRERTRSRTLDISITEERPALLRRRLALLGWRLVEGHDYESYD